MKIKFVIICIAIFFVFFTSCESRDTKYESESYSMGTVLNQKIYTENGENIANDALKKIDYIERIMSVNIEDSEVVKINGNAGNKSVKVSSETMQVIKTALEVSKKSRGAFDITVYPIVNLWGIGTENENIPSDEDIDKLLPLVNYEDIELNEKENTVYLKKKNQEIDLGGIAKGFAGNVTRNFYKEQGVDSAIINFGGNVVTLGSKINGDKFSVGIQNPRENTGVYLGILKIEGKSVVTSGDYERYFEKEGKRYHHIIDPKTGKPSESGLMSVTIVTESSIKADAISTAAYVLGLNKGIELIEDYKDVEAIFITDEKNVYVTDGLRESFTFKDESGSFNYEKR